MENNNDDFLGLDISIVGYDEFTPVFGNPYTSIYLKIDNKTPNERIIHLQSSTYVTNKREQLEQDGWQDGYMKEDDSIKPYTFKKTGLMFNKYKLDKISDNDKVYVYVKLPLEGTELTTCLTKRGNNWDIISNEKKEIEIALPTPTPDQLKKRLLNSIERFEAFEERLEVSIQNISINVESSWLEIFCEVHSTSGPRIKESMQIEFIIYDKDGKIMACKVYSIQTDRFYGFEVVNKEISIDNIVDISKIRIYPHK